MSPGASKADRVEHGRLVDGLRGHVEQLQHALDHRIVIEQAKGVLAERHGITPAAAFDRIRHHARSHRERVQAVALAVVAGSLDP